MVWSNLCSRKWSFLNQMWHSINLWTGKNDTAAHLRSLYWYVFHWKCQVLGFYKFEKLKRREMPQPRSKPGISWAASRYTDHYAMPLPLSWQVGQERLLSWVLQKKTLPLIWWHRKIIFDKNRRKWRRSLIFLLVTIVTLFSYY